MRSPAGQGCTGGSAMEIGISDSANQARVILLAWQSGDLSRFRREVGAVAALVPPASIYSRRDATLVVSWLKSDTRTPRRGADWQSATPQRLQPSRAINNRPQDTILPHIQGLEDNVLVGQREVRLSVSRKR